MHSLRSNFPRHRAKILSWPSPRLALAALTLLTVLYGVYFVIKPPRFPYPTFRFELVGEHTCDDGPNSVGEPPIPNLVHYVWLLQDPGEFRVGFKFFVSVYSAHYFWRPERIYIHTDATPEVISRATEWGTRWTKRVLAIPRVTLNHVEAPHTTQKGVRIGRLEHKSDFVRLAALREYGGVYLDADAMPLRDIAALRSSGFRNVIGQQTGLAMWFNGYLNNGVMMAVPGSNLMTIFYHAAHEFYDGEWDTASIKLLTDLGNRAVSIPAEVLILQPQAFNPTSWEYSDQRRLFLLALKAPTTPLPLPGSNGRVGAEEDTDGLLRLAAPAPALTNASSTCRAALAWVKHRAGSSGSSSKGSIWAEQDPWELDFSSTYVLHAVDNHAPAILGHGRSVDVKYILARRSNYARALFPAVWAAVTEGIIPPEEAY